MDASNYQTPTVEMVYDLYADMLYRISYTMLMSKEDAEDNVAEVFLTYIKKRPEFNEKEHEKAWFIKVTVNHSKDMMRKRKIRSHIPLHEITNVADDTIDISDDILSDVLALPDKFKAVIVLHYFEDLSIDKISSILGISKSGVKMRLLRGRELLKTKQ